MAKQTDKASDPKPDLKAGGAKPPAPPTTTTTTDPAGDDADKPTVGWTEVIAAVDPEVVADFKAGAANTPPDRSDEIRLREKVARLTAERDEARRYAELASAYADEAAEQMKARAAATEPVANAVHWAADLIPRLKETHTGEDKLNVIRECRAKRFHAPAHAGKPPSHPDRHATAHEALTALERAGAGEVTLDKVRQLMTAGTIKPPEPVLHPGDAVPAPPDGPAPYREAPPPPPDLLMAGGVVDFTNDPGETVGPKSVDAPPER